MLAGASCTEIEMRKKRFSTPAAFKIMMECFCRNIFRTVTRSFSPLARLERWMLSLFQNKRRLQQIETKVSSCASAENGLICLCAWQIEATSFRSPRSNVFRERGANLSVAKIAPRACFSCLFRGVLIKRDGAKVVEGRPTAEYSGVRTVA